MSKEKDDEEFSVDHYGVLGIPPLSAVEQINKAARKLSLKYHPDKNSSPEAASLFLRIQKSKEFLNDNVKRAKYDEQLKANLQRKAYDEERHAKMDESRVRSKADFEARLAVAQQTSSSQRQDNARAKKEAAEILRFRRENIALVAAANEELFERQFRSEDAKDQGMPQGKRARTDVSGADFQPPSSFDAFVQQEKDVLESITGAL